MPALRARKLVRRALPTASTARHRPAAAREASTRAYPPSDSAVFLTTSRYYRPAWAGYRYHPAHARRLLEQRAAAAARTASTSAAASGSRSGSGRSPGRRCAHAVLQLVQAQLREAGVEVVPRIRDDPGALRSDPPEWRLRRGQLRVVRPPGSPSEARMSSAAGSAELHGLLPAARHARSRPGRADPRRRRAGARPQSQSTGRSQGRSGDPALPDPVRVALRTDTFGTSLRGPFNPLSGRGELVARARALAAALAVSLLAVSGAGGSGAQAPRRGGTSGRWDTLREPAMPQRLPCPVRQPPSSRWRHHRVWLFAGRFALGRLHVSTATSSRAEYTTTRPSRSTYHIRPEARWSDGVPVTRA